MSYCIAFSNDGATDVTRRYVRDAARHGATRDRCPEEVLMYITNEIKQTRRDGMTKDEKHRLIKEDQREERELRSYVVMSITSHLEKLTLSALSGRSGNGSSSSSSNSSGSSGEIKLPARTTGTEQWRRARRENGPEEERPREQEGR
jgi:peptide-N4-(N-acetyl-beta-glucosaminyl)asparagine amidase